MASARGRGSWWRKPAGCRSQEQDLGALPGRGHCAPCPVVPSQPRLAREAAAASHRRWISCTLPGETATSEASVPLPHRRPGPCGLCAVPAAPEPWQSDSLTPSQGPGGTSPLGAHRPHRSWDTAAFLILGLLPNEGSGCALCTGRGGPPCPRGALRSCRRGRSHEAASQGVGCCCSVPSEWDVHWAASPGRRRAQRGR